MFTEFTLTDEEGRNLRGKTVAHGTFLHLFIEGYGNPISLDFYGGKLSVLLDRDHRRDDNTERYDLEGAKLPPGVEDVAFQHATPGPPRSASPEIPVRVLRFSQES